MSFNEKLLKLIININSIDKWKFVKDTTNKKKIEKKKNETNCKEVLKRHQTKPKASMVTSCCHALGEKK